MVNWKKILTYGGLYVGFGFVYFLMDTTVKLIKVGNSRLDTFGEIFGSMITKVLFYPFLLIDSSSTDQVLLTVTIAGFLLASIFVYFYQKIKG